ncbi:MAG: hypothetical protein HY804_00145 [Nitrospinae bacterium]|nr:hypothetical protein [Nitrospinota bacterium]
MTGINTGAELRHAFRKSPAWGQPAQAGAGDGAELGAHTLAHRIERIPHGALGHAHSPGADKGNIRLDGYIETYARYGDLLGLALVAGAAPAPTPAGASSYTHTITPADNIDGLCATWIERRKSYTLEAVLKPHAFTLYGDAGRALTLRLDTQGFDLIEDSTVNTLVTFAAVTIPDTGNRLLFSQMAVRINAASGAALTDTDKVYPSQIVFRFRRQLEGAYTGQYAVERGGAAMDRMDEPVNAGPTETSLELRFPVSASPLLLSAFKSDERKKLDLVFTGREIETGLRRSLSIELPAAELAALTTLDSSRGRLIERAEFLCHQPAAAPAGMTGIATPWRITAVNTRSTSYLE